MFFLQDDALYYTYKHVNAIINNVNAALIYT